MGTGPGRALAQRAPYLSLGVSDEGMQCISKSGVQLLPDDFDSQNMSSLEIGGPVNFYVGDWSDCTLLFKSHSHAES
jgi:hypothetical protein